MRIMFKKYLLNTSGNFSIMFAVGAAVLLLGVGAAIDISGATSQRTHLQDLTDAAVLAAVTSGEEKPGQLKKIVAEALAGRRIPGIMDVDCGEEVLELTHDLNTVKARINSLTASENTYIPVGLVKDGEC